MTSWWVWGRMWRVRKWCGCGNKMPARIQESTQAEARNVSRETKKSVQQKGEGLSFQASRVMRGLWVQTVPKEMINYNCSSTTNLRSLYQTHGWWSRSLETVLCCQEDWRIHNGLTWQWCEREDSASQILALSPMWYSQGMLLGVKISRQKTNTLRVTIFEHTFTFPLHLEFNFMGTALGGYVPN